MSSAKKKSEKPNAELTTMQIFSKALTGGSEWCDKVIHVVDCLPGHRCHRDRVAHGGQ